MDTFFTKRNTIIVVGLLILWKIYLSATLQLHPDEAYYWLWSRHLDFGYFDHAPLIAWAIRLTTLFSQQELWVRFTGIIGAVVTSICAWVLTMQLFPRQDNRFRKRHYVERDAAHPCRFITHNA